jgi:hypothetical protein
MKIDQNIIRAISQYIAANKTTQKAISKQLGISEATMVKWHTVGCGITDANWTKLYALIKRYLPKDRIYISSSGQEEYSSLTDGRIYDEPALIPVLTSGDLAKYNAVVSIEQFAQTKKLARIEYRPKVPGIGGMFEYVLETASAGVPQGARLFVSSEAKPRNGSLVLAVTGAGEVMLGVYNSTGREFELDSGANNTSGSIEDIRRLFAGFFPVITYEVICY